MQRVLMCDISNYFKTTQCVLMCNTKKMGGLLLQFNPYGFTDLKKKKRLMFISLSKRGL